MNNPSSSTPARVTRYFYLEVGQDGVDDTIDIVSVLTGHIVASFSFWAEDEGEEAAAKRDAKLLIAGLNALARRGGRLSGSLLEEAFPELRDVPVSFND